VQQSVRAHTCSVVSACTAPVSTRHCGEGVREDRRTCGQWVTGDTGDGSHVHHDAPRPTPLAPLRVLTHGFVCHSVPVHRLYTDWLEDVCEEPSDPERPLQSVSRLPSTARSEWPALQAGEKKEAVETTVDGTRRRGGAWAI
jgi:hypothetical protein